MNAPEVLKNIQHLSANKEQRIIEYKAAWVVVYKNAQNEYNMYLIYYISLDSKIGLYYMKLTCHSYFMTFPRH